MKTDTVNFWMCPSEISKLRGQRWYFRRQISEQLLTQKLTNTIRFGRETLGCRENQKWTKWSDMDIATLNSK